MCKAAEQQRAHPTVGKPVRNCLLAAAPAVQQWGALDVARSAQAVLAHHEAGQSSPGVPHAAAGRSACTGPSQGAVDHHASTQGESQGGCRCWLRMAAGFSLRPPPPPLPPAGVAVGKSRHRAPLPVQLETQTQTATAEGVQQPLAEGDALAKKRNIKCVLWRQAAQVCDAAGAQATLHLLCRPHPPFAGSRTKMCSRSDRARPRTCGWWTRRRPRWASKSPPRFCIRRWLLGRSTEHLLLLLRPVGCPPPTAVPAP